MFTHPTNTIQDHNIQPALCILINDDDFKNKIGVEIEKNKIDLPVNMGSLNKVKTDEEIAAWRKGESFPDPWPHSIRRIE